MGSYTIYILVGSDVVKSKTATENVDPCLSETS